MIRIDAAGLAAPLLAEQVTETHAAPAAAPGVETFAYNADNRLVSRTVDGVTTTYTYDANGSLVKKSSTDGMSTIYVGGVYEKHQDGSYVTYYRSIAVRTHPPAGGAGDLYFLLSDHLGSTSMVMSATGEILETAKYYPFGAPIYSDITVTDKKFTGQQDEGTEFGLYNYGARFYSTTLGQFLSADPLVTPGDPQMLDHYSYVRNNPLNFADPSGLYAMFVCGMNQNCEGGGIGGFQDWVKQYWMIKYNMAQGQADAAWDTLLQAFDEHMSMGLIMMAFDVAFFDTEGKYGPVWQGSNVINLAYDLNSTIGGLDSIAWRGGMDTLIGFSFGGVVAHDYVWGIVHGKIGNTSGDFDLVLLQPGFHVRGEASVWEGWRDESRWDDPGHPMWRTGLPWPHPYLSQADWGGTIITVNETWLDKMVYGTVEGADNLTSNECKGGLQHCEHPKMADDVLNKLFCPSGCVWPAP